MSTAVIIIGDINTIVVSSEINVSICVWFNYYDLEQWTLASLHMRVSYRQQTSTIKMYFPL